MSDHLRLAVSDYIQRAKVKNPRFSLRAFALKLDLSPGNLSRFLAGKRNLSAENTKRVVHLVCESPEERKNLLLQINQIESETSRKKTTMTPPLELESSTLTEDEFLILDEWYYFAVRTVLSLKNPRYEISWIAATLGIPEAYAEKAINTMLKLGLLSMTNGGVIERTKKHLRTPDSVKRNEKIDGVKKKIHAQHLDHAKYSLENHGPDVRDITWLNLPANPRKLNQARELIRKFQDDMVDLLEDDETEELYRLSVQLCPMKK